MQTLTLDSYISPFSPESLYTENKIDETTKALIAGKVVGTYCPYRFLTANGVDLIVRQQIGCMTGKVEVLAEVAASPAGKLNSVEVCGEGKNYEAAVKDCTDKLAKIVEEKIFNQKSSTH